MIILGLTGAIGMGKSQAAALLAAMGCAVYNADAVVHALLAPGGAAVASVAAHFPQVCHGQVIDRQRLGDLIFQDPEQRKILEGLLHPMVQAAEHAQIIQARAAGYEVMVLEIPLLFETGAEERCDATVCVTAPSWIQRRRVLARPGMTRTKFDSINAAQMPDREKCRRADYVVHTGFGYKCAAWQLRRILRRVQTDAAERAA